MAEICLNAEGFEDGLPIFLGVVLIGVYLLVEIWIFVDWEYHKKLR